MVERAIKIDTRIEVRNWLVVQEIRLVIHAGERLSPKADTLPFIGKKKNEACLEINRLMQHR
jgi:hypothetical protein